MLSKLKNYKHGNVSTQSLGSPAHAIFSANIKKPISLSYELSDTILDETIVLPRENPQNNVEQFDITTGINGNSPEIISFSNFIPVYGKNGELNEFGNYLRKKQDAYLVRASSNISNLLSSPSNNLSTLTNRAFTNSLNINSFCENSVRGIENILTHFSSIKRKMDFRTSFDKDTLRFLGLTPPRVILNDNNSRNFFPDFSVLSVEEILLEKSDVLRHWTPTKIWIQACLELKEVLSSGMVRTFLSDGDVLGVDPTNYAYYDTYTLVPARSSLIKKFGFSSNPRTTTTLQGLIVKDPNTFRDVLSSTTILFSDNFAIFNDKILSDGASIDESIAKVSHILCKEYVYSTKIRTDVVSDYGYPFTLGAQNTAIWNHLIGQAGADITDIKTSPLGGGKSLISLAQSIEPDGVEVLSFEDRYINDNVGTIRPDAVIAPGTIYYVESSVSSISAGGFDVTRLGRYITRLNSANNMLRMIKEDLSFLPATPYATVNSKVLNKTESATSPEGFFSNAASAIIDRNKDPKKEIVINALSNPINLIRHIEQVVLNGSGLLRRSNGGPKLFTNKNFFDITQDVSPLLISLALDKDDAELKTLLFLHQIYNYGDSIITLNIYSGIPGSNVGTASIKNQINELILERIKSLLNSDSIYRDKNEAEEFKLSMSVIKEALSSPKDSPSLRMLNKIGQLIFDFEQNFDKVNTAARTGGRFFLEKPRRGNTSTRDTSRIFTELDNISAYSGVQKTSYLIGLFKLCCLMIHAANPERLIAINKPRSRNEANDNVSIKKIRNAIVGTFVKANLLNQGITKFTLSENDVEGMNSFGPSTPSLATAITTLNKPKKQIKIFELPNSSQSGIKILDIKNPSKKTIVNNEKAPPVVLYYDEILVKTENMLADYDIKLTKFIDRFYGFVYALKDDMSKLKNNLQSTNYQSYGQNIRSIINLIGDPSLNTSLLSDRQLLLMKSRMHDYTSRLNNDYVSPIKESIPHFLNLHDKPIENYLPIEDVHLVSWNLLLEDFLKDGRFFDGEGSNKKIMSIGIPQKLHRRMRVNASRLSGDVNRNSLIQLCIYRVNSFLPDVIYKPLVYDFDLNLFSTKTLSNYKKCGFNVSQNKRQTIHAGLLNLENLCTTANNLESLTNPAKFVRFSQSIADFIPQLKSNQEYKFNLVEPTNKNKIKENYYSFLNEQRFNQLYRNHSTSFLLEEYLRFVTDLAFDENRYTQYDIISKKNDSKFTKFAKEFMDPNRVLNRTFENFFNDENLVSNLDSILKNLVIPKKFDRVFHIIFDPDDFEIDSRTSQDVIQKYIGNSGRIEDITKNETDEPTFDKYYVVIKSNEGSDAS